MQLSVTFSCLALSDYNLVNQKYKCFQCNTGNPGKIQVILLLIISPELQGSSASPKIKPFPTVPKEMSTGTFNTDTATDSTDDTPVSTTAATTTTTTQGTPTFIVLNPTSRPKGFIITFNHKRKSSIIMSSSTHHLSNPVCLLLWNIKELKSLLGNERLYSKYQF